MHRRTPEASRTPEFVTAWSRKPIRRPSSAAGRGVLSARGPTRGSLPGAPPREVADSLRGPAPSAENSATMATMQYNFKKITTVRAPLPHLARVSAHLLRLELVVVTGGPNASQPPPRRGRRGPIGAKPGASRGLADDSHVPPRHPRGIPARADSGDAPSALRPALRARGSAAAARLSPRCGPPTSADTPSRRGSSSRLRGS